MVTTEDVRELFEIQQQLNKAILESIKHLEDAVKEIMALLTQDNSRG